MTFTLVICTYKRSNALLILLQSVKQQTLYPDEILIIDGSPDEETKIMCDENSFKNLTYFQVPPHQRGLTKQRNYGIEKLNKATELVCFLDDDTLLAPNYFAEIIKTFIENKDVLGVGGEAVNENRWVKKNGNTYYSPINYYMLEDYVVEEALRNKIRNRFGLQSNLLPGQMPTFSHGRTCGYPLNGKNYQVDMLVGMSMAFKSEVFKELKFSTYFEGYGLYEDADFTLRLSKRGKLYVNTAAQLEHHHNPSGRPNMFKYGQMVVRNGWYVWRVKWPNPAIKAQFKWHTITLLLAFIRLINVFTTNKKMASAQEFCGRFVGWVSLFFNKPQMN